MRERVPGHVLRPATTKGPPVVVLAELFGITAHVLAVCERLAAEGFPVVCPDLYHRTPGASVFPENDAGRAAAFAALGSATQDEFVDDIASAADLATGGHPERCALLGLSAGGYLGFVAATRLPLARVALVYPGWLTSPSPPVARPAPAIDDLDRITGSVLLVVGEDDFLVTDAERTVLRERLTARGHRLVSHPGVGHGYLAPSRPTHDERAAEDTWRLVLDHLRADQAP
ncbi:dienelactone hydrolase family protein [Labedaea rhizosphaerae]|uniref:Carboxymethylenebutenolidase n=1 Tax=Labedaea rhizosphaerae TaxID=598644 RepID=A0A4R6S924_LABRH|nr:dienelactone hydrolase family protein [Labedaea rhizosphaerae]TDP96499.1 carboxymethylenebutenolidase [Labedaea rhizosphaerae]